MEIWSFKMSVHVFRLMLLSAISARCAESFAQSCNGTQNRECRALRDLKVPVWPDSDCAYCDWHGVLCNERHDILRMDLQGTNLQGAIPHSLGLFSSLRFLDLSRNHLQGQVPDSLGKLSSLRFLDLSRNHLGGQIPDSLSKLSSLRFLDLSRNHLGGGVPDSWGKLSSLRFLNLSRNHLGGGFPDSLGKLSSLRFLDLSRNQLGGGVPDSLGKSSSLRFLDLSRNQLEGGVPDSLGKLSSLRFLDLSRNQLEGGVPDSLGKLSSLRFLDLSRNKLEGGVPDSLRKLSSLRFLDLSRNQLEGGVPDSLGKLSSLRFLDLSRNQLEGAIPDSLGSLKNLTILNLARNQYVNGSIPIALGGLSSLRSLDLSMNSLQGEIPASLGSLQALKSLDLSWNPFVGGYIPYTLGKLSSLERLDLSLNFFAGEIPGSLGCLKNLTFLSLSDSGITGSIPEALGELSSLEFMDLRSNWLQGMIPDSFGLSLSSLEFMDLSSNRLQGRISDSFGLQLSSLRFLNLSSNRLQGMIPASFGLQLSSLRVLDLSGNSFQGEIPVSFGSLRNLLSLHLSASGISGRFPEALVHLSSLRILDLSSNALQGTIPASIGSQLSSLESLDLSRNRFQGELPTSFGSLTKLASLRLSNLAITVSIPNTLAKLSYLRIVDLRGIGLQGENLASITNLSNLVNLCLAGSSSSEKGNLSGTLPWELGSLEFLEFLDISNNHLEGNIPRWGASSFLNLKTLHFEGNQLTGPIPSIFQFFPAAWFGDNSNLCGLPLDRCDFNLRDAPSPLLEASSSEGRILKWALLVLCVVAPTPILALVGGAFYVRWRRKWQHHTIRISEHFDGLVDSQMTPEELRIATDDFHEENFLGHGDRSVVYKGRLPNGDEVAVKVLDMENDESERRDVLRELQTLGRVRHRNLLKLLGVCLAPNLNALVLEYMPEKSLERQLYKNRAEAPLPWEKRFDILVSVAHVLTYLHGDCREPIIHCDLKPSNILLDSALDPKVADFGIAKFVHRNSSGSASMSGIRGTIGYIPPEYAWDDKVSTKGDVYSYGIVVLELLTARPPCGSELGMAGQSLVEFSLSAFHRNFLESLDPFLTTHDPRQQQEMNLIMRVGLLCTRASPKERPSMLEVLHMLAEIKLLRQAQGNGTPQYPSVEELANMPTIWMFPDDEYSPPPAAGDV